MKGLPGFAGCTSLDGTLMLKKEQTRGLGGTEQKCLQEVL